MRYVIVFCLAMIAYNRILSVCILLVLNADEGDFTYKITRSTMNAADLAFFAHLLHREIDEMTTKAIAEYEEKP